MSKEIFRTNDENLLAFPAPKIFQCEKPEDLLGLKVRIDSCKSERHTEVLPCVCIWIGVLVDLTKFQYNTLDSGYRFQASFGDYVFTLDRDQFEIIN